MNYDEWMYQAKYTAIEEVGEEIANPFFYNILKDFYDPTISPELGAFRTLRFLERECPMLVTFEGVLVDEM